MRFQAFSFASKKVQEFSSDRKILMSLLLVFFNHLQNRVSVFWNLILILTYFSAKIFGETFIVPEIKLTS